MRAPRVQFTVRRMMSLVLIVGVGLGWVVHRVHVQQDAVTAILRAGGAVQYDWQYEDGSRVVNGMPGGTRWLARAPGPPYWLARALGPHYFDSVTHVTLLGRVTDADMDAIAGLDRVETL